jgi:hypothetical protein
MVLDTKFVMVSLLYCITKILKTFDTELHLVQGTWYTHKKDSPDFYHGLAKKLCQLTPLQNSQIHFLGREYSAI